MAPRIRSPRGPPSHLPSPRPPPPCTPPPLLVLVMPVLADKYQHDTQSRALPLPERRLTSIGSPGLAQSTTTPMAWLAGWRLGLKMKHSGAPGHTHSTSPRQPAQPREAGETPRNPMFPSWLLADARHRGHTTTPTEKGPGRERRLSDGCRGVHTHPPPFEKLLVPVFCRDRPSQTIL
ncbi:hypothetical protein B0T18DRAFT_78231 [Schizothecium vesticola]|uniref:Uncharacterized protein n=1 Tax=Schizothecium vesticola TaxID=314040 RepID=A0AA40KAS1_9PEZI|nr:hypothetical protein B0T18DRAFT_78231 [Schizothecium vesticola]